MSMRQALPAGRGFTLLELLVVLALVAMMTGLAAPRAIRWLESAQERGWRHDLKARIELLPVKAFRSGQPLSVDAAALVQGLQGQAGGLVLRLPEPLQYGPGGLARGGVLELLRDGQVETRWRIQPVTGKVLEEARR